MVQGATPLFIDTGAFFAWAYEQAERHDHAQTYSMRLRLATSHTVRSTRVGPFSQNS